jgi:hypothetical protein
MKKAQKFGVMLGAMVLFTFSMFISSPAYADSASDYKAKVAAAQAKVDAVSAQLVTAKNNLDQLKANSATEAQALADAQTAVFLAEEALASASSDYSSKSSAYDSIYAQVQAAENMLDETIGQVNNTIDLLNTAYDNYVAKQSATDTALAAMNAAQTAYDNSSITTGGGQVAAGLRADIYTGIHVNGNPPQRSDTAYTFCKTITVTNINKDWGGGNIEGCGGDYVMIHYRGFITYPTNKQVYFFAAADDGFFMTINGQNIINDWSLKGCGGNSAGLFNFTGGQSYAIDAWMYEWGGGACNTLYYQPLNSGQWSVAPASFFTQQALATTAKDPALKTVLDAKTALYVQAVEAEEQANSEYISAEQSYDNAVTNYQNANDDLFTKQQALSNANDSLVNAENLWQSKSDAYADSNAVLTNRKNTFASVYNAMTTQAQTIETLEGDLVKAKAELAAIPKPTTPPKVVKKTTSTPAPTVKVTPRPKFTPNPK